MNGFESPPWLDASHLEKPVRRVLGTDDVTVSAWTCERLAGAGESLGVWRVTGDATVDGSLTSFALILKGWAVTDDAQDPTAWDWPHRELRACASGMLDALPGGIVAPRCVGEVTGPDGSAWAWLTPMSDGALTRWNLDHFALVARHLGQFNGAYLTGTPLPEAHWLSRQWCRKWTEAARDTIEHFDHYAEFPGVARMARTAERREIERLFAERHRWFDAIDALPQTFCHLDAFPRNVFLRPGPDGELTPHLVDWSFTGIASVGEELASLVSSSVLFGEAESIAIETLDETVFGAYIAGLRDAGWHGDEQLARMAYTGSLALRYLVGPLRVALPVLASPHAEVAIRQMFGISLEEFDERLARHSAWAWGIADEFRDHLRSISPHLPDAA